MCLKLYLFSNATEKKLVHLKLMNYAFDVRSIYRFKNSLVLKQIASKWNINSKIILQLCAINT